jgi:flagellar biosynthesis component FlhA
VAPTNHRQSSLQTEAKTGLSSLMNQLAQGFAGLLAVVLLTGGAPSGFTIGLTFCMGVAFIAWKEKQRTEEIIQSNAPEISEKAENSRGVPVTHETTLDEKPLQISEPMETLHQLMLEKQALEKERLALKKEIAGLRQHQSEERKSSPETPV